jgi:preprotein translocase subunit SecE
MSVGKTITVSVIFGLLFWLINHWFYWLIVGWVLTVAVSESIEPESNRERIRLTGVEILVTGAVAGMVLYGIDRLFAWL